MTTTIIIHGHELPQGWTVETDTKRDAVYINRKKDSAGFDGTVTVNFRLRGFCGGYGGFNLHAQPELYSGRKWRTSLVRDACEWLEKTMTA